MLYNSLFIIIFYLYTIDFSNSIKYFQLDCSHWVYHDKFYYLRNRRAYLCSKQNSRVLISSKITSQLILSYSTECRDLRVQKIMFIYCLLNVFIMKPFILYLSLYYLFLLSPTITTTTATSFSLPSIHVSPLHQLL